MSNLDTIKKLSEESEITLEDIIVKFLSDVDKVHWKHILDCITERVLSEKLQKDI